MHHDERRQHQRTDAEIACKVRRDARTVFSPGRTINISAGGAALDLIGPREARPGERIAVAFEDRRCPVSRSAHMVTGTVIRATDLADGTQRIALAFDTPQHGIDAYERPMAA